MSEPDLRAEIARNIVAPLRAFAPIDLCDQAEQDIIDCLPPTVRRVDDRREAAKAGAMQLSLLRESGV
jgi:hypothetical protein